MKRPLKICRSRSRPILRSRARTSCWLRLTARSDERRKRRRKCNSSASSRKARARKLQNAQSDCWKKNRARRPSDSRAQIGALKFNQRRREKVTDEEYPAKSACHSAPPRDQIQFSLFRSVLLCGKPVPTCNEEVRSAARARWLSPVRLALSGVD